MQKILKKYSGLLYIAVITALMAVLIGNTDELGQIVRELKSMDGAWVCAAGGCILGYLFLRMATLKFYLSRQGCGISWSDAAGVTGAGQFYSAITPSASGGQPMQVLWMHRMGVPVSVGTAGVSVKFIGFQTSFLALGALMWIIERREVAAQLTGLRWLVALGFVINSVLIAAVLLTVPNSRAMDGLLRGLVAIGRKLRIVRNPEKAMEGFRNTVKEYRDSLVLLLKRPADAAAVFGLSLLQVLIYMMVPVCLYRAFGLSDADSALILTVQLLLFIAAAFIPLPGAAGAQESGFCVFFRGIFPEGNLIAAMLCWRFFSYYLLLIAGLLMMSWSKAVDWRKKHAGAKKH